MNAVEVPLSKGMVALISPQDAELVLQAKWHVIGSAWLWYAYTTNHPNHQGRIAMHNLIVQPPPGLEVDHKNRNGLDNRRENLRIVTPVENQWNKGKKNRASSRFRGVTKVMRSWVAYATISSRQVRLGTFRDEVAAAIEHDIAILPERGVFAQTNFPMAVVEILKNLPPGERLEHAKRYLRASETA